MKRPIVVFPLGVEVSPSGLLVAPYAVLVMAAEEPEQDAPPARPEAAGPGIRKTLPPNVVALPARRSA